MTDPPPHRITILSPKINGNIEINTYEAKISPTLPESEICILKSEKFYRHVGGIYHQIQSYSDQIKYCGS